MTTLCMEEEGLLAGLFEEPVLLTLFAGVVGAVVFVTAFTPVVF